MGSDAGVMAYMLTQALARAPKTAAYGNSILCRELAASTACIRHTRAWPFLGGSLRPGVLGSTREQLSRITCACAMVP